jgi:hypothetical protein
MMVKCMRCRIMLPKSLILKIMRFHDITPGLNRNQIQAAEFKYIIAHNIGKRFFGYMCTECWVGKKREIPLNNCLHFSIQRGLVR